MDQNKDSYSDVSSTWPRPVFSASYSIHSDPTKISSANVRHQTEASCWQRSCDQNDMQSCAYLKVIKHLMVVVAWALSYRM